MAWFSNESKEEIAERIAEEIELRRERGEPFESINTEVKRGHPCTTFWGKAWCENIETYVDFETRLPRGRSYLRAGNVYDLEINEGEIFAYVTGSEIYEVFILINSLPGPRWDTLKEKVAGKVTNLVDLLTGKLGPGVLSAITDPEEGLFPEPGKIRVDCSCPDYAGLCKHAAAVLYAVGVKLDAEPELFFKLRKVDHRELIAAASEAAATAGDLTTADESAEVLAAEDLSELFGIEIAEPESAFG
ncbi:MAG: hypothetical protein HKN23_20770 [Verrucomicrobiales bacterium]|nr:hypothetical protein [Verrucomicrobiales bacterium]